jgi:hypothetical protein
VRFNHEAAADLTYSDFPTCIVTRREGGKGVTLGVRSMADPIATRARSRAAFGSCRCRALIIAIRANIRIAAVLADHYQPSAAVCHSEACCSTLGSLVM